MVFSILKNYLYCIIDTTQLHMYTLNFISFSEILSYWDIIIEYVNPFTIILWAVVGGFVGLIIVLVAELILSKKILIRRRHWSLKFLAYSYMVFFPLFTGFCFAQWFAIHGCEREIVKNMPTYLGEANKAFNVYLKDEVEKIIDKKHLEMTGHEILDKTVSYAGRTAGEVLSDTELPEGGAADKASAYLMDRLVRTDFVKDQTVRYVENALGEKVLKDKDLTTDLLNVKIENILTDGVLNTILQKYTRSIFGGFKMNVLLMFLLVMAIPIAEIVLAHYLEKKRLRSTPPPIPDQENN